MIGTTLLKLLAAIVIGLIFIALLIIAYNKDLKDDANVKANEAFINIDEVPFTIIKNPDNEDTGKLYLKNKSLYQLTEFSISGKSSSGQVSEYSIKEEIAPGQLRTVDIFNYEKNFELEEISYIYRSQSKNLRRVVYDKALNSYKIWDMPDEGSL